MNAEEKWLPVVGQPGYFVSDQGRVVSHRRRGAPAVLRGSEKVGGYRLVILCLDGSRRTRSVHSLVCEAFHGPRPLGQEVRHLNGDPSDNRAVNLKWGTKSENVADSIRHGTHGCASKTHCKYGHVFDEANTRRIPSRPKARYCRACARERHLAWRARRALAAANISSAAA